MCVHEHVSVSDTKRVPDLRNILRVTLSKKTILPYAKLQLQCYTHFNVCTQLQP